MRTTKLFNKSLIQSSFTNQDYIDAMEYVHTQHGKGEVLGTNLIHGDAPNGEYHIKTGGITGNQSYYGLKANGGFFNNTANFELPNILGIIYISDAANGFPLAIFESVEISKKRTAAASAVAAKLLAPKGDIHIGIIGTGTQASEQLKMIAEVLPINSASVWGRNKQKAIEFAKKHKETLGFDVKNEELEEICKNSSIIVTCTNSTEMILKEEWIKNTSLIIAVGADSPGKQELDPKIVAKAKVVGDIKSQIVKVGESQHAIRAGLMQEADVYAELGELLTNQKEGRKSDDELFIYDSTGTAIQDVAVAAMIYEKMKDDENVVSFNLFD